MVNKELNLDLHINNQRWKEYPELTSKITIKKIIKLTLDKVNFYKCVKAVEISVIFTDDIEIQKYNKKYRAKDKPTNVLSFPVEQLTPNQYEKCRDYTLLGDIMFAIETIISEAQEQNKKIKDHFTHLLVHSVLHLLGFDHEEDIHRLTMEKLEVEILSDLGIVSPYK